ncbi:hypothetical protein LshimejAT787_0800820 [Lyophyllum shimeji]|uniref:HTH APSES-type domain-containing protein n=1 Tax=Lyophyllum shimeji TaxID=47721 RepID=A0A9P3URH1_LYOSH|nr:hypothetical protein LshimejAT787_0800820 [Lyophyllum shimeji]
MGPSPRPPLPVRHANPHIPITLKSGTLPPVKYQILNCQGHDILVGRLKIETPTPTGHAFILRRFDTGAVSLTTMFRAAFPNAADHEEKNELQWVKENYDLSGNNGGPHHPSITRLAGTWVSPALARTLGDMYALGDLITAVVEASPDPNANYRRSAKSNAQAKTASDAASVKPVSASAAAASLPTPSPTSGQPNPSKRRKESSPAPAPAPVSPPTSPAKIPPRRTSRARSPAPRSAAVAPLTSVPKTPRTTRTTRREEVQVITPEGSDLTVVDEETDLVEKGIAGSELHEQDIAEQQALVQKLKAERDTKEAAQKEQAAVEDEDEEMEAEAKESSAGLKRARKDDDEELKSLKFQPKEPEVGERAIATNSRVGRFQLQPKTRQLAWGTALFALGMGAIYTLPQFL